jgi:leader peptidase (prepilin peptidase)/N-methyltransferase
MDDTRTLLAPLVGPYGEAAAFVLGAILGSFYNVCIYRIPAGQSIVRPGSRCQKCGVPIRAVDNIPILSYFVRRGRCRSCGAAFSPRYAVVEALSGMLALFLYARTVVDGSGPVPGRFAAFGAQLVFVGVLLVLSGIDLDTLTLPDRITLPAIPIFLVLGVLVQGTGWIDALVGAAVGFALIFAIVLAYRHLAGREGMGEGDAKLLAAIGAFVGIRALPFVLFVGSVTGALVGIVASVLGRGLDPEATDNDRAAGEAEQPRSPSLRQVRVPFGPFLALGAVAYLFVGPLVMRLLFAGLY